MANITDGNAFVAGRNRDVVRRLLALTEGAGLPIDSVKTRQGGYEVLAEVADLYEKEIATETKDEAKAEPEEKPKRTRAPRKKSDTD
jgi:hypothetical protein